MIHTLAGHYPGLYQTVVREAPGRTFEESPKHWIFFDDPLKLLDDGMKISWANGVCPLTPHELVVAPRPVDPGQALVLPRQGTSGLIR